MSDSREQLAAALKTVNVAMRRMRGRETQRQDGLSYAQYGLLFSLEGGGARSARELGDAASLSPASVTQMLDALEAQGLVARTRSAVDRRVVMTELTEEGVEALREMRARTEPAWRAALSEFSDAELGTAAAVLERLADYFTALAEQPSDAVGVSGDHGA